MEPSRPPAVRWDSRSALLVLLWCVCVGVAGARLHHARTEYDTASHAEEWIRPDGNAGHTHIDFGGQWVMARMVVTGHARQLYDRNRQWQIVRAGYPESREPKATREQSFPSVPGAVDPLGDPIQHNADNMMAWFLGKDSPRWQEVGNAIALPFASGAVVADPFGASILVAQAYVQVTPSLAADVTRKAVGGPLYPPIHGFLYSPLGLFADPAVAYAAFQYFAVATTFVAGFVVSIISRKRIWWPAATIAILLFPGYRSGLDLGQNPIVTLSIVLVGWLLMTRQRELAGGVVWGLLSYKPVWAAAFLLVPLAMGRWRFCSGVVVAALGLVATTLPFTGFETWSDWLANSRTASANYATNKNWIELSRDLHGIPRRILTDFTRPEKERCDFTATVIGWGLWSTVLAITVVTYRLRADRKNRTGLGVGLLFLGALLTCYHFMYYDILLSLAGVVLLFIDPKRLMRFATGSPSGLAAGPLWAGRLLAPPLAIVGLLFVCENTWQGLQPAATVEAVGLVTSKVDDDGGVVRRVPKLTLELGYYQPWETILILALWAWCSWRLAWGPDVGDA